MPGVAVVNSGNYDLQIATGFQVDAFILDDALRGVLAGYTTTTTRTNLVPNPNFEVDLLNWVRVGAALTRITTDSYSGVACAQLTKNAGRNEVFIQQNEIFVSGSTTYTISAYMKVPVGEESMSAGVRIIWYDSAGVQIAPGFIAGTYSTLTSADGWQRRTITATSPANAFSVRVYCGQTAGGTAGQLFLFDSVLVEAASSALPYFDGTYADTYTGYTLTEQGWNGTADASTSTATWGLDSSYVAGTPMDSDYALT